MKHPRPMSGYAFTSDHSADFREIPNDDWEAHALSESHFKGAKFVGTRHIDGTRVNVWLQKGGARYIAQTAYGDNPISTGGLVAIGLGVAGILAAIFWPKSASAAPGNPPAPGPGTPSPTPPTEPPPVQPPQVPPPTQPPPGPGPGQPPPTAPPTTTTQPVAPALSALVALWEYQNGAWVEVADVRLGISDLFDPTTGGLDLAALYAAMPQYKPNPPPYQYFRVFTSDGSKWTQIPIAGMATNYSAMPRFFTKGTGTSWSWVRTWMWSTTGWRIANDTGAQQSAVPPAALAAAIKDMKSPPYYYQQVFTWQVNAWVFATAAQNY